MLSVIETYFYGYIFKEIASKEIVKMGLVSLFFVTFVANKSK